MINLLMWGAGQAASELLKSLREEVNVIGFVDSDSRKKGKLFHDYEIYDVDELKNLVYDYLVITTVNYGEEVFTKAVSLGADSKKIIPCYPLHSLQNEERQKSILKQIFYFDQLIAPDGLWHFKDTIVIGKMPYDQVSNTQYNSQEQDGFVKNDYVRMRTFELVADEINKNKIPGEIAEVGVFRGDFAKWLSFKFPERKLHLFDTFDGFNEAEYRRECVAIPKLTESRFKTTFNNVNVDEVINKMAKPENVIIHKGYFPDTTVDCSQDIKFAFVSVDVDLQEPIYHALEYFYPRLTEGGYLFVHEYNDLLFQGVKKAIEEYEKNYGKLKIVPIADVGGTGIIIK